MSKVIAIFFLALSTLAWGDEAAVCLVKNVTGEATVTTAGKKVIASPGTAIYQGSVLQTGAKSSMGVTLKDETVLSFGADTVFSIDEYLYVPSQNKLKFTSKITKGSLNYLSGVIAKLQPDAIKMTTPSGVIGVRGTQFLVKVEE